MLRALNRVPYFKASEMGETNVLFHGEPKVKKKVIWEVKRGKNMRQE